MSILEVSFFTEDSGDSRRSCETIKEIFKQVARYYNEDAKTNHFNLAPLADTRGINGSCWKERKSSAPNSQERSRKIVEAVATDIALGKFIVFHVDADETWENRGRSHNALELDSLINRVTLVLQSKMSKVTNEFVKTRILFLVPHYSIEAWTYSNTVYLLRIVEPNERTIVEAWQRSPHLLDEIERIKNSLKIEGRKNYELSKKANGFSVERLISTEKSFKWSLDQFNCKGFLLAKLAQTAEQPF